jgi:hypothetical protein
MTAHGPRPSSAFINVSAIVQKGNFMGCTVNGPQPTTPPPEGQQQGSVGQDLASVVNDAVKNFDAATVTDLTSKFGNLSEAVEKAGGLNDGGKFKDLVAALKDATTQEDQISALQNLSTYLESADFSQVESDPAVELAMRALLGKPTEAPPVEVEEPKTE